VSVALIFMCTVALVCGAPARALAIEYALQTASLLDDAFYFYVRGSVGNGVGELAVPALEEALDADEVPSGALLYDREMWPGGGALASSFGAVPVRPTGQTAGDGRWQTVRWDGTPGERVVWVMRPASMFRQRVKALALSAPGRGLHYFLPYRVSIVPQPLRAVVYNLTFLRSGESGGDLWDRYLSRAVDLEDGLAAIVGQNYSGGDWIYFVIEQPSAPTTFRAVVGWARSPLEHQHVHGGRDGGIHIR
jgi:hypothetical protein